MPALSDLLQLLRRKGAILFPQINLWYTRRKVDREERVETYREQLEDTLADSETDLEPVVVKAEEAHRSELERGRELDSKAGRYVGNTGVVLSVIGLTPILSVILGLSDGRVLSATWPHLFILSVLTYSVISLLCSAYYSTKALQMRPYSAYFTADAIQKRIQDGCRDDTEVVKELLVGKKKNEEHNIEKSNYISVSESCSLNGLIGLGVGFGLTAVLSLPLV